jgi:DNA replication protein DnaC
LVATPPPPGPGSPCRAAPPEARHHAAACPRAAGHRQASHWSPEEFLRTLLEAEIASGDLSNATARMKAAAFRVRKTIEGFDVAASSISQVTFDYLASLEWIRAKENPCLIGPPRNPVTLRSPLVDRSLGPAVL